ncbi:Type IV pilus biogenesis protein PilQ, partial [hydrothermal vent metagenome]
MKNRLITRAVNVIHNKLLFSFILMILTSLNMQSVLANSIEDISYSSLPGNRLQINIRLTEKAEKPLSFNIDNPARIAFDFSDIKSKLPKKRQQIDIGVAQSLTVVTVRDKTRVILNLSETVPYNVVVNNNIVSITLENDSSNKSAAINADGKFSAILDSNKNSSRSVTKIDFRRGDKGEGRVLLHLSEASIPMDISEEFGKIVISFSETRLPKELHQRLDVLDFATPVKNIDSFQADGNSRILIETSHKDYTHLAYQTGKLFTIEFIPISQDELEEQKKAKFGYTGDRLSLNFQDIPVRAVLQLIADFTGLNVVVSDSVDGNLTLRLKNVPWDQALDIILKAKGLSKRESGNVMLIAPSEEIAAQEKIDLEALAQVTELAPVRSAFFEINFAKVTDLASLFEGDAEDGSLNLLSPRGSVIMDERTNTLIVKDTDSVISEIRRTLAKLDIPVRQVLIESRIVIATDDFKKELGVRFGATGVQASGSSGLNATTGTFNGTDTIVNSGLDNLDTTGSVFPVTNPTGTDRLNVNIPVVGAAGSVAFTILSGGNLLDLELSALQAENNGEI